MGLGTKSDYIIESHAFVTLSDLTRASDGIKINTATVKGYLCEPAIHPDAAGAADLGTPGEVGIPIAGHGLVAGDYVVIFKTINYDLGYVVLTANTTADKIFFAASQTAETFTGLEDVFKVVEGSTELTLIHDGADPDGYFSVVADENPVMMTGQSYFRVIVATVTGSGEIRVFVDEIEGKYG
jgi:hypothetical protein